MLTPFVLTARQNLEHLTLDGTDIGPEPIEVFLVDDASTKVFGTILNYTNQLAFGGDTNMGMPLWVLLDCGILSSAVVGFALPRDEVSEELAVRLGVPPAYEGLVPISEYCACPTLEHGCVSGFSLQTQLPGRGIASRTKALALLVYGARKQVGVTQFDNPAIRVHARFGPMQLTIHRPSLHTHAANSFAYRLTLPDVASLAALSRGEFDEVVLPEMPTGEAWSFHPAEERDHQRLHALLDAGREVWIVPPGWESRANEGCRLHLVVAQ